MKESLEKNLKTFYGEKNDNFFLMLEIEKYKCIGNERLYFISYCPCVHAKSLQLCPTLCGPMDHSPPGSSVHGILQARILEWVAMSSSRGSSQPRDQTRVSSIYLHWQAGSLPLVTPGKPLDHI